MLSDIEIAHSIEMAPISEIAAKLGVSDDLIEPYGKYKAKIDARKIKSEKRGKLILVTAINPIPAGEGKTTVSIGLADSLSKRGIKTCIALREPSLGPVFGMKGGAAGGGYAQVVPMEDINLHFTGDLHAITAANNLIAALLDNSIHQGNPLGIDPRRIVWKRCMDMNDRQLRFLVSGLGGKANGTPREEGFDITTASEVMASVCLAEDIPDLKRRIGRLIVARSYDDKIITVNDLKGTGAASALLKDALKPNLVQTLEKTPAFVHGGPFANIAHGCNSVIATKTALKLADAVVTEAGFGADLGAEKFIDIKCRLSGIRPDAVVIVASARALKHHGGADIKALGEENLEALKKGICNLTRHLENIKNVWSLEPVVAINKFSSDTEEEIAFIIEHCKSLGSKAIVTEVWEKGSEGGLELADAVMEVASKSKGELTFTYPDDIPIKDKIRAIATNIYRADDVVFQSQALKGIKEAEAAGYGSLPVCIAKTQYSFTDNPKKLGAPTHFTITISRVKISAGAGFIVAYTGDIMTMPGLSKTPAANDIDLTDEGEIVGLF